MPRNLEEEKSETRRKGEVANGGKTILAVSRLHLRSDAPPEDKARLSYWNYGTRDAR